ncbi:Metal-dependent hydrolase, endonuclease/exonuclease/phosphatase family [Thalassovita litoralis]|jgi:endonuclease/exonuclease/phosphatase family metal-dependent hydrolase|uniref:Metal-dependent hydrolase, endonuclease/exonuclease/phosphatase family n=1 Tax=Thalassovita litoralis TaxID=1010611 RepID=A0A521FFS6_9RHOB|nr:endonuclease/exonuclease/phosphatase family protein [Thalassovita litoralis]SMO95032.1 Metal-dependent hydrolase, endonuclease/exonuclease/phosphatase family [Thalassovita litoralis]
MIAPTLRIASYNLQKCVGMDLRRRPDRSLTVIGALSAQVVVLQEADKRLPPRPTALPHAMIEDDGWRILPFGQPGGSLGWHGNAMLVRPDITVQDTAHLDLPGLEPRGAIRAELDTPIGPLRVIGTHLGLIRRYRVMQMAAISRYLADLPPRPTVLAGDMNEWGSVAAMDHAATGLEFVLTRPSYPAPRPVARLDRFALSPDLIATQTGTHLAQPARVTSDHLPVWADLAQRPTTE